MKKENQIEIYVSDDSDIDNAYWTMKCYRNDIYVKYNNKYYKMYAITYLRFKSDLAFNYERLKIYSYLTHILVVGKLKKRYIISTILEQAKYHYFDMLKECEVKNGEILYLFSETVKKSYIEENWSISCPISKLIRIY